MPLLPDSLRRWFYQRRLQRYQQQIAVIGSDLIPLADLPLMLSEFWRQVNPEDFTTITARTAMSVQLSVSHDNLPGLIASYSDINEHIANQHDLFLETLMANSFNQQRQVLLDQYLADDQHMAIDLVASVTRLRGVLMHHRYLLELQTNQYYHRLSERVYRDTLAVTRTLVETIL